MIIRPYSIFYSSELTSADEDLADVDAAIGTDGADDVDAAFKCAGLDALQIKNGLRGGSGVGDGGIHTGAVIKRNELESKVEGSSDVDAGDGHAAGTKGVDPVAIAGGGHAVARAVGVDAEGAPDGHTVVSQIEAVTPAGGAALAEVVVTLIDGVVAGLGEFVLDGPFCAIIAVRDNAVGPVFLVISEVPDLSVLHRHALVDEFGEGHGHFISLAGGCRGIEAAGDVADVVKARGHVLVVDEDGRVAGSFLDTDGEGIGW